MNSILLQDGRHIGLCEYGDLPGFPVFFFTEPLDQESCF